MSVTWPALYLQFMCTTENYPFKKLVDPYVPILNKLQDTLNEKKKDAKRFMWKKRGWRLQWRLYTSCTCAYIKYPWENISE